RHRRYSPWKLSVADTRAGAGPVARRVAGRRQGPLSVVLLREGIVPPARSTGVREKLRRWRWATQRDYWCGQCMQAEITNRVQHSADQALAPPNAQLLRIRPPYPYVVARIHPEAPIEHISRYVTDKILI